jgi:hypothetical protein
MVELNPHSLLNISQSKQHMDFDAIEVCRLSGVGGKLFINLLVLSQNANLKHNFWLSKIKHGTFEKN